MKPATKSYLVLFLVVLITVSCGPVTSMPPVTVTSTIKPIFRLTPTETLTPSPTIESSPTPFLPSSWEYSPPTFSSSTYKVRSWTKADYALFINSMNEGKLLNSRPLFLPVFNAFYGYEYFLHADQVDVNDELAWTIAQMGPIGVALPGMRSDEHYFLVEQLLNNANVSVIDLRGILKSHGFGVTNTLLVKDFYGKGKDAFFFDAMDENGYLNISAIFAVQFLNGAYQVHTIKDWQWMFGVGLGRDYSFEGVVDTNHNGFPEMVIGEYEGHSGQPPTGKLTVSLNEWDDQKKNYRINSFTIFDIQECREGACDGNWKVENASSNVIPTFVVQEYYPTQTECPDLTVQRRYHWDGKEYPLEGDAILPSASKKVECAIAWAETAIRIQIYGWQNDQAIQVISEALNQWPDEMDKTWGPASRDYFRLLLGIWRDLRGESAEAVKLLKPLAATPYIADYPLPSQTAAAYLQGRKNTEIVSACQKANEVWKMAIETSMPDPFDYAMLDKARVFLGFTSNHWNYSFFYFASVCSIDDAIFAASRNLANNESVNPANWFTRVGRSAYIVKQEDFNRDGLQDWLIVAQTSKSSPFSTEWFFFRDSKGFDAYELDALFDGLPSSLWRVIQPDKESGPVYLVQSKESLWIFRVNRAKQIEALVDDYGVKLLQIDQSEGIRIKVSAMDWEYKGEKIKNYVWDAPSQTFVTLVEEYDFESTRQRVEQLIFQEQDYLLAISLVQQFLAEAPLEYLQMDYCIENKCEYHSERYYPALYYLMGVAYEMSGQPEQAARTYYSLWRDYPDSPYALMAKYKLEPINP